jgi:hypothetical protein
MKESELFELYERLYFHELEVRDGLDARLQMPMAIIVAVSGAIAFLLQNIESPSILLKSWLFVVPTVVSAIALIFAVYFFIRSWYGHEYAFIPSASEAEEYRKKLIKTYKPYRGGSRLVTRYFRKYLYDYYVELSSNNTQINDQRSLYIHKARTCLIAAVSLLFVSFLVFYFSELDKSKHSKVSNVRVIGTIDVRGVKNDR